MSSPSSLLLVLFAFISSVFFVQSEVGCSDYDCECHPDQICHPPYAKENPCKNTKNGCYGPVIGTMFTITVDRSVANTLLPSGLELGTYPDWNDANKWPIQFFFNQQQNVDSMNYLEFILMITYVQWNDTESPKYKYRGPFGYGSKLYLDKVGPTLGGQAFGINKEVADVTQSCDDNGNCNYIVNEKESPHNNILNATWTTANARYMNATQSSNFEKYQRNSFELPIIGKYPVSTGVFQCIDTEWFIDNAMIQPVTGTFEISKSFYGNIPVGTYELDDTINQNGQFGAYRMETMWMFEEPASPDKETCTQYQPPN